MPPLFQKGLDTNLQAGPTMQKVADREAWSQTKRKGLEGLFDVAAPLGMYSGEAHGIMNPFRPGPLDKTALRLRELISKGASVKDIRDELGLVSHSGIHDRDSSANWSKYTPTPPKNLESLFSLSPTGIHYPGQEIKTVSAQKLYPHLTPSNRLQIEANPFELESRYPGKADTRTFNPETGNFQDPKITLNTMQDGPIGTRKYLEEILNHEIQHPHDKGLGLSPGTSLKYIEDRPQIIEAFNKKLAQLNPKAFPVEPYDVYMHNAGEIRARQNSLLEGNQEYNKFSDAFTPWSRVGHPGMQWETLADLR